MPTWDGEGTLYDGVSSRARPVHVDISRTFLVISAGPERFVQRLDQVRGCERRQDGSLRLSLALFPDGALRLPSTVPRGLLQEGCSTGHARRRVRALRILVASAALLSLLALFFTWGVDRIVDASVDLVPEEVERRLGSRLHETLVCEDAVARGDTLAAALEKCRRVLETFDARGSSHVTLTVIDNDDVVNAMALPGGHIILYGGILQLVDNEHELFGLLAHELAHVQLRHGLRHVARSTLIGFLFTALFGESTGVAALLVDNSALLLDLAYGRDEEREADAYAVEAVARAGFDPEGLLTLFDKLSRQKKLEIPEIVSTHPPTRERIALLEQQIARVSNPAPEPSQLFTAGEWRALTE
jgi:predicted Zn-dependent protease